MDSLRKAISFRERGAALIIVLAFVVLLTGVAIAYLSRSTGDRQVAHSSFHQSSVDQLVASAMDNIIGDLRQEIVNGSASPAPTFGPSASPYHVYTPTSNANMVPQRSGNAAGAPNLIRRSVSPDLISAPGRASRASGVNSRTDPSANGRYVTSTRWNAHYLVPKGNTATADSSPIPAFTDATPDWVFVKAYDSATQQGGATVITSPDSLVIGRYAYAIYDEGGLLDANVAGYPSNTTPVQPGRKGSEAFADLTVLGMSQLSPGVDTMVGWRNFASAQYPTGTLTGTFPTFTFNATTATNYVNSVLSDTNGFTAVRATRSDGTPNVWQTGSGANIVKRTDQMFSDRQSLIDFRASSGFEVNALQYLGTFSRETNAPSFSPETPTATNPSFLLTRVPENTSFTRFDGTTAKQGEPLVKTRFPLSRLAWITYKGPSADVYAANPNDSVILALTNAGVPLSTIQAGTAANIQTCFGLTFGANTGDPWTYSHGATNRILRLGEVATLNPGREPDFFELLQAGILSGSLGQNTAPPPGTSGGGVTGQNTGGAGLVFPDIHMSNTTHHIFSIGAAIIDQADPDSIPMRIQSSPSGTLWSAYGVENLPYITQIYPIAGTSPDDPTKWATYLLFQLWNPHQNPAAVANNVRLRIDGGIGIFTGGNNQTWNTGNTVNVYPPVGQVTSVTLKSGSFSIPTPLETNNASTTSMAQETFAFLPAPAVPSPTP